MENSAHAAFTTSNPLAPQSVSALTYRPEFFPLPSRGRDVHFGFSRSAYYSFERSGQLRLVRVRRPGNVRGKVLVPYAAMVDLIRKLSRPHDLGVNP
jgi:hypothetical protein